MSVYIKGMEMPRSDETITITICGDGLVFEEWEEPGSVFEAVPVPEHGRLIDADALLTDTTNLHVDVLADWVYVRLSTIEDAPTIIPASKEGEG